MTEIPNHPDFDQLLQLVDENAPTRTNRWVRRHVAACWICRSHLEELQETVREVARYHEKVLLPNLPAPPRQWPDLRSKMQQIEEVSPLPDLWSRVAAHLSLRAAPLRRLIFGGVVCGCAALAFTLALRTGKPGAAVPISPTSHSRIAPDPVRTSVTPSRTLVTKLPSIPSSGPSSTNTEVQIFAALHGIDADLGDPIEISTDARGSFKITGVGLTSARQAEVRAALASLPDVAVDFPQSGPAGGVSGNSSKSLSFEAGRSPFEARLQQFLGGQAAWESYSNQVLDESDAVLVRAYALHTLQTHFPAARRAELRELEKTVLDEISETHRRVLAQHVRSLESLVAPVRDALNAPPPTHQVVGGDPLVLAQRMDQVLSVIFGVASTNRTPAQLISELSQASAGLQSFLASNK